MERDRNEPEEIALEDLHKQDTVVCRAQDVDSLKLDKEPQKNGNATQKETSKLGVIHDAQQLMQEKEPEKKEDKTQDSLQKSKNSEPSYRELVDENSELKKDANTMDQQKVSSFRSLTLAQDSNQADQLKIGAVHQECDAFEQDKLLESDRNSTEQRIAETTEDISLVTDQKSIQKDNDATHQECDRSLEVESKSETNKEGNLVATMKDPLKAAEHEENVTVPEESDETTENDRYLEDDESGAESEEPQVCLRPQQLEDDASGSLPRRTCHHRACITSHHILQELRLSPVQEDPEPPAEPFEVEIEVSRYRILRARLLSLLTEMGDYMQRVRDRHIPPEIQSFCQEFQRCGKFICIILIGATLIVAYYYLIDFLDRRYG